MYWEVRVRVEALEARLGRVIEVAVEPRREKIEGASEGEIDREVVVREKEVVGWSAS